MLRIKIIVTFTLLFAASANDAAIIKYLDLLENYDVIESDDFEELVQENESKSETEGDSNENN